MIFTTGQQPALFHACTRFLTFVQRLIICLLRLAIDCLLASTFLPGQLDEPAVLTGKEGRKDCLPFSCLSACLPAIAPSTIAIVFPTPLVPGPRAERAASSRGSSPWSPSGPLHHLELCALLPLAPGVDDRARPRPAAAHLQECCASPAPPLPLALGSSSLCAVLCSVLSLSIHSTAK